MRIHNEAMVVDNFLQRSFYVSRTCGYTHEFEV